MVLSLSFNIAVSKKVSNTEKFKNSEMYTMTIIKKMQKGHW